MKNEIGVVYFNNKDKRKGRVSRDLVEKPSLREIFTKTPSVLLKGSIELSSLTKKAAQKKEILKETAQG